MARNVVNSSLVFLSIFGASRQVTASKTVTSYIRKNVVVPYVKIKPSK